MVLWNEFLIREQETFFWDNDKKYWKLWKHARALPPPPDCTEKSSESCLAGEASAVNTPQIIADGRAEAKLHSGSKCTVKHWIKIAFPFTSRLFHSESGASCAFYEREVPAARNVAALAPFGAAETGCLINALLDARTAFYIRLFITLQPHHSRSKEQQTVQQQLRQIVGYFLIFVAVPQEGVLTSLPTVMQQARWKSAIGKVAFYEQSVAAPGMRATLRPSVHKMPRANWTYHVLYKIVDFYEHHYTACVTAGPCIFLKCPNRMLSVHKEELHSSCTGGESDWSHQSEQGLLKASLVRMK